MKMMVINWAILMDDDHLVGSTTGEPIQADEQNYYKLSQQLDGSSTHHLESKSICPDLLECYRKDVMLNSD